MKSLHSREMSENSSIAVSLSLQPYPTMGYSCPKRNHGLPIPSPHQNPNSPSSKVSPSNAVPLIPRSISTRTQSPHRRNPSRNVQRSRNIQLQHGVRNIHFSCLACTNTYIQRHSLGCSECIAWRCSPALGTGCCSEGVGQVG